MDVTPVTLRDVTVLSGDGAKPHGRDTSSSNNKEENKTVQQVERREYPVDTLTEALAARLRMADPKLDSKVATQIAKTLLGKGEVYADSPAQKAEDDQKHFDVSG